MNSVGVVILDQRNRVLLQKRDLKDSIYFPGFWGLFGGACEPNENPKDTVSRELQEELSIEITNAVHFLTLDINSAELGGTTRTRHFYFSRISEQLIQNMQLKEGSSLSFFDIYNLPASIEVVPFDMAGILLFCQTKILSKRIKPI